MAELQTQQGAEQEREKDITTEIRRGREKDLGWRVTEKNREWQYKRTRERRTEQKGQGTVGISQQGHWEPFVPLVAVFNLWQKLLSSLDVIMSVCTEPPTQKMYLSSEIYVHVILHLTFSHTQTHTHTSNSAVWCLSASSMCWVELSDFCRLVKCNHSFPPSYSSITAHVNGMLAVQRHRPIVPSMCLIVWIWCALIAEHCVDPDW